MARTRQYNVLQAIGREHMFKYYEKRISVTTVVFVVQTKNEKIMPAGSGGFEKCWIAYGGGTTSY